MDPLSKRTKYRHDVIVDLIDTANHSGPASLSQTPQPYEYKALESADTIRLFCLEPSESSTPTSRDSILHVSRHAELSEPSAFSKYEAVSHTWGNSIPSHRLFIHNGHDTDTTYISITPKVESMLQGLRKLSKKRFLWIDAICLNQNDEAEKSRQIPLMGQVFSQAHKVIFWLEADIPRDVGKVFAYIRHLALRPEQIRASDIFENEETATSHVQEFLRQPWFYRRWILQEAALARHGTVHCGHHTLPWSRFLSACHWMGSSNIVNSDEYSIEVMTTLATKTRSLLDLLWNLEQSDCSDKRDRIAALYGLLPRSQQLELDYETTYQNVYKQHAIAAVNNVLQHEFILHLFAFPNLSNPTHGFLLSWVPDWSVSRRATDLALVPQSDYQNLGDPDQLVINTFLQWKQTHQFKSAEYQTPDWILWREWLLESAGSRKIRPDIKSITYFSTWKDKHDRNVLNASWLNPLGEVHGRAITKVVTVPTPCDDWRVVRERFMPLILNICSENANWSNITVGCSAAHEDVISKNRGLIPMACSPRCASIEELDLLLEHVMDAFMVSRTLQPFDGPQRALVMTHALYTLFTGEMPTHKVPDKVLRQSPHLTFTVVTDIIVELGNFLYEENLAIAEVSCSPSMGLNRHSYAVSLSGIEQGMVLVPLSSRTPSQLPWPYEGNVFWRDLHPGTGWENFENAGLTNMLVVKFIEDAAEEASHIPKIHVESKGKRLVPPRQARYVGPCVLLQYPDYPDYHSMWKLTAGGQSLESWILEKYAMADEEEQPPPFTIDII
jgi:hypothetical protein